MIGSTSGVVLEPEFKEHSALVGAGEPSFDALLARIVGTSAVAPPPEAAQQTTRGGAESAEDGQESPEHRRRTARADLASLAVEEMSSRADSSPSAAVQAAQQVMEQDRAGMPAEARPDSDRAPRPSARPSGATSAGSETQGQVAVKARPDPPTTQPQGSVLAPQGQQPQATRATETPVKQGVAADLPSGAVAPSQGGSAAGDRAVPQPSVGLATKAPSRHTDVKTSAARPTAPPPRPFELEQTEFGRQVGRAMAAALRQKGGSVTMRLAPEALGDLRVQLTMHAGRVDATFEASTDQARQLLEHNLTALKAALEAHGLAVDRLGVQVMDRPPAERQADDPGTGDGGTQFGGAGNGGESETASEHAGHGGSAKGKDRPGPRHERGERPAEPVRRRLGGREAAGGALRLRLNTVA